MAAAEVSEVTGPPAAPPRRRRGRGTLSSYLLLSPMIVLLLAFFVAPLYYVFLFSTGQRYQGVTKAAAFINGELTSFSWDRWAELLGSEVSISIFGASLSMPLWLFGVIELALLTGALRGNRLPRYGREATAGALVLLVLPFVALPVGASVARVAEVTSDNPSITLFFRSVSTSLTVSVLAVLMAFPVAYYLAFCRGKSKYTWLVIVIAPFLTSYLLRVLAFKVILTDDGLVNTALFDTGLREDGDQVEWLLYTQFTVLLVLLYAWVPFVTLPIFVALENMDRRLLEAATDLGASRARAFVKITLPIAAPGIVAAFLFVFIPTIGEFVTPAARRRQQGLPVRLGDRRRLRAEQRLADGCRLRAVPDGRRPRPVRQRRRASCAPPEVAHELAGLDGRGQPQRPAAAHRLVRVLPDLPLPAVRDPADLLVQLGHDPRLPAAALHDAVVLGRVERHRVARRVRALDQGRDRHERRCHR